MESIIPLASIPEAAILIKYAQLPAEPPKPETDKKHVCTQIEV